MVPLEVQIHTWFRPMVTHGSQCSYKYDPAWVAGSCVSGLDYHWSVVPTMCECTVIITWTCAVAITLTSHSWLLYSKNCDSYAVLLFMLYYCLCCNTCTVTQVWLEPIFYRRSDACGSSWTMHGHKCAACTASDTLGFKTTLGDTCMA